MKTLDKIEKVFYVCVVVYMALAFGLTFINIFVEMPYVGPAMLLAAPWVLIIGYLISTDIGIAVIRKARKEGR